MTIQSLNGAWLLRQAGTESWMPAVVPGCVHTDLLAQQRIPDPFTGLNEKAVKWVAESDWEYQRVFPLDPQIQAAGRVDLVCAGLDTLAEIFLNGRPVARTGNIFREYRFDVSAALQPGENTLAIRFHSPYPYIQERQAAHKLPAIQSSGIAHVRKVQSHFGWDWGPALPSQGIWRDIFLEGVSVARLQEVSVRQEHAAGQVKLAIALSVEQIAPRALECLARLTGPDGLTYEARAAATGGRAELSLTVANPQLWQPNGLGEQPLYALEVSLCSGEQRLDQRALKLGLRTLELRQSPDEWGKTFTFVVNGTPIFAKGADWIPADSFITRYAPEQLEHLIRSAAQANMNMLRVWGGGYYESDAFYDLCDRYGILVWQDFGFACAAYPLDEPEFLENVRLEVQDNVRRLRHHASLALWCGNNEIEMMWGLWKKNKPLTAAYQDFFYGQLEAWLKELDPERPFWTSSPSSNTFLKDVNGDACGDTHLWQVWHGLKPFSYYQTRYTRFCSEFGLESLPDMQTIAAFSQPEDFSLTSKVLLHHQRSVGGNEKMVYYLTTRFRLPRRFEDMVYLTQIMQAECVRTAVEHWRRNRPRCSGALYWQFNDCWPVASWASIDYYGRWKALQYAAKRFYAPVALSCNRKNGTVEVFVANDYAAPWQGEVRWSLETLAGQSIQHGAAPAHAPAAQAGRVCTVDANAALRTHTRSNTALVSDTALVVELWREEALLDRQVVLFADERNIPLPAAGLSLQTELEGSTLRIRVQAAALARFVELRLPGSDAVFSDNFFDLPAGRSHMVTCPLPPGWTLQQAQQALSVHSLADVEPNAPVFFDHLRHFRSTLEPINIMTRVIFAFMK